jgi:hypothetical protein
MIRISAKVNSGVLWELYCDIPKCRSPRLQGKSTKEEFSEQEVREEALIHGWSYELDSQTGMADDLCPCCVIRVLRHQLKLFDEGAIILTAPFRTSLAEEEPAEIPVEIGSGLRHYDFEAEAFVPS